MSPKHLCRKTRRRLSAACVLALALVCLALLAQTPSPDPDYADAVWVSKTDRLVKIALSDGSTLLEITDAQNWKVAAADEQRGFVWAYNGQTLRSYDFNGTARLNVSIAAPDPSLDDEEPIGCAPETETDLVGLAPRVALAINPNNGAVWLAVERTLYHFNDQGQTLHTLSLPGKARALALDKTASKVWVATKRTLKAYDESAALVGTINLGTCPILKDMDVDSGNGDVWVALKNTLKRYDSTQTLLLDTMVNGIQHLSSDSQQGVWVTTEESVQRRDSSGQIQADLVPFDNIPIPDLEGLRKIVSLGADPLDLSVWVGNKKSLKHIGGSGAVVRTVDFPAPAPPQISDIADIALYVDTIAPAITFAAPASGALLSTSTPVLQVQYRDVGAGVNRQTLQIQSSGVNLAVTCTAITGGDQCTPNAALPNGVISLTATVRDWNDNLSATAARSFTVDTIAPVITVESPANNLFTNLTLHSFVGQLSETATLTLNTQAVTVGADLRFNHGPLTLQEGINDFHLVATDTVGNAGTKDVRVTLDTVTPGQPNGSLIQVGALSGGNVTLTGLAGSVEGGALVTITNSRTGQTVTVTAAADGSFTVSIGAQGSDVLLIKQTDPAGNNSPSSEEAIIPPDPTSVAPTVNRTVATSVASASAFLYSGSNPVQSNVAAGTIEARRVAVLRGKVINRDGAPLSEVIISIAGRPEFGQTVSRADGMFDLVVNGGQLLTVSYRRFGSLPAHRQINPPWRDYVKLADVALVSVDSQVTVIGFSAPIEAARGNPVTDSDGTRQATLLFSQGTAASMTLVDGSTKQLSAIAVRATEYTVGTNGPAAMPGELPPSSGYTYAVELSADEAIAAGAKEVQFNQPVLFYVENFLNFPVGGAVPAGWYDRGRGVWTAWDNGRIVKILSVTGGLADLDIDGTGIAANAAARAALGISDAERQKLAVLYSVNQSLWRVPVTHFTPGDWNWPSGPPSDARPPGLDKARLDDLVDNPCRQQGSIIECENQVLGEAIGVTGASFGLHYQSDRVVGRKAAYTATIPVTGPTVPASLKRVELILQIAGRRFSQSFSNAVNQSYNFVWDGQDVYGRTLQGAQTLSVRVGHVYDGVFRTPAQFQRSFAVVSGAPLSGNRARQEWTIWQDQRYSLGAWDARAQALGGWSLGVHHVYDFAGRILYLGTGQRRSVESSYPVIGPVKSGLGGVKGQSIGADGSIYFSDLNRVRRLAIDGTFTTVAGTGTFGFSGDGGPATAAKLAGPGGTAIGADGSFYIVDTGNQRVRRVGPDGIITTIAGTGTFGSNGDGGAATEANLANPADVALGPDGSIYIADTDNNRIRRISTDGIITTLAGTGVQGWSGDAGPAPLAKLARPNALAVGVDGSVFIADRSNNRIRRVTPDGIITTVAGNGLGGLTGDGGLATQAALGTPFGVAVDGDGSFYVALASLGQDRVRRIGSDGVITTVAGNGQRNVTGDGGPATQAPLHTPADVATGPDGNLYIGVTATIRRITPSLLGFSTNDIAVPSEDGSEIYVFDLEGRHLRTIDALTNAVRFQFTYDSQGRLIAVQDGDGDTTTIERNGAGNPTAIVAHDGQRTTLALDANGYFSSITNPASQAHLFVYSSDGLLTQLTDPRNNVYQFTYDTVGRLATDADPAAGSQTLVRSQLAGGREVTRTTALNRVSRYRVETLGTGTRRRTMIAPDNTQTVSDTATDGRTITTTADGTLSNILEGPDPRFGMQSPFASSQTVTTPGGLVSTSTSARSVTLSDPNNILTLTQQTDTATINGRTFTAVFAVAPKRWTLTSAQSRQTIATVDSLGRVLQQQIAAIDPINYTYDTRGRLSTIVQGAGADTRTTTLAYNASGYLASTTDASNRITQFQYDAVGRVTTQTLPDTRVIQYAYDANGNVTSVTPPGRTAHAFAHTPVDLQERYTPPDVGAGSNFTRTLYNQDRQPTQIIRPDSQTIDFGYDTAGRLGTLTIARGAVSFAYHPTTGNLSTITAPGANTLTYSYDGSLVTSEAWAGEVAGTVARAYDNNFRVTSQTVNGGNTASFSYDNDSLLTGAGSLTLTRSAQNGLLTATTLGSATDAWGYSVFGEPLTYSAAYGGSTIFSNQFTRDKLGRITQKTETIGGITDTYAYRYDTAGRLDEVKKNNVVISTYAYDSNSNRLTHTTSGGTTSGNYDAQDRLTQYGPAAYTYTANGELATKTIGAQTTAYQYDQLGNLTAVTLPGGTAIDYIIDGQNRRVGKKVNGVLVQGFLYQDQLEPVAELDGAGAIVSRFVYASRDHVPDYMIKAGVTYRIISDHLGSPRLMVDTSTGAVAQRIDYDEFGDVLSDTAPGLQPFGFGGGIYDLHTGLTRFGARDYDAAAGRWTAKDPILFSGGDANLYDYGLSDPLNSLDTSGRGPVAAWATATFFAGLEAREWISLGIDSNRLNAEVRKIDRLKTKLELAACEIDNLERTPQIEQQIAALDHMRLEMIGEFAKARAAALKYNLIIGVIGAAATKIAYQLKIP